MKNLLFILLFICSCYSCFGQISFTKDKMGNDIIEISVTNIIKCINLSNSEFNRIVLSKEYKNSKIENDCNDYIKGSSFDGTIHDITKCSFHFFSIGWYSLEEGNSYMKDLLDDLEKYFVGYDSSTKLPEYRIKYDGSIYGFYLSRSTGTELVMCKLIQ